MAISSFSSFSVLPPPPPPPPPPQAKIEPPAAPPPAAPPPASPPPPVLAKVEAPPVQEALESPSPAAIVKVAPPEPKRYVPPLPPDPRPEPFTQPGLVAGVLSRTPLIFLATAIGVGVGYWLYTQQPVEIRIIAPAQSPLTKPQETVPPVGTPGQSENLGTLRLERDQLRSDLELQRDALRTAESSEVRIARLDSNKAKASDLERRLTRVKTDRDIIVGMMEAKKAVPVAKDTKSLEEKLAAFEADKQRLGLRLGPDHPEMIALQTRINALKAELKTATPPVHDLADFRVYLAALSREQESTATELTQVQQAVEQDEDASAKLRLLQAGFDSNTIRLTVLDERIALKENATSPIAARPPETTATTAEKTEEVVRAPIETLQLSPLMQFLLLGGLGGLLVGGTAATGLELASRPARPMTVARSTSGVPMLGRIPRIRTDLAATRPSTGGLDATLVAFHRPTDADAVAIREIRTQMNLALQVRDHQVVQITSPSRGDGKSTLAANLAIGLAQSGKKVILVDADFRSPRVHALFALANPEIGLAAVLASEGTLKEAVDECEVPNLTLLLSGTQPANPEELLSSAKFADLIAELRMEYEFVIVDSPPVLAQRDATLIAEQANGVVLVTRSTREGQNHAARALEQLASVDAHLLGTAVNP